MAVLLLTLSWHALSAEKATEIDEQTIFNYKLGFFAGCANGGIKQGQEPDVAFHYCSCLVSTLNRNIKEEEWVDLIRRKGSKENQGAISLLIDKHKDAIHQCHYGAPNNSLNSDAR